MYAKSTRSCGGGWSKQTVLSVFGWPSSFNLQDSLESKYPLVTLVHEPPCHSRARHSVRAFTKLCGDSAPPDILHQTACHFERWVESLSWTPMARMVLQIKSNCKILIPCRLECSIDLPTTSHSIPKIPRPKSRKLSPACREVSRFSVDPGRCTW